MDSTTGPVNLPNLNLVISVPADDLAPYSDIVGHRQVQCCQQNNSLPSNYFKCNSNDQITSFKLVDEIMLDMAAFF